MIDFQDIENEHIRLHEMARLYLDHPERYFLFYSAGSIGRRSHKNPEDSESMEMYIAALAQTIVKQCSVDRLIVAGGETSGAVTMALGLNAFQIGDSIAPGVPVLHPVGTNMSLVLKSGNFGDESFFLDALKA